MCVCGGGIFHALWRPSLFLHKASPESLTGIWLHVLRYQAQQSFGSVWHVLHCYVHAPFQVFRRSGLDPLGGGRGGARATARKRTQAAIADLTKQVSELKGGRAPKAPPSPRRVQQRVPTQALLARLLCMGGASAQAEDAGHGRGYGSRPWGLQGQNNLQT